MAAARSVIAEKGHENTLLSDIAERAGIVEGSLYRFFTNKQELLVRVAEDWLREETASDGDAASIRGTWNQLRYLVGRSLQMVRRNPPLSRFLYTEIRSNPNYRNTAFYELNHRFTAEVRRVFESAMASGEFRSDVSTRLLRDMVFGCIEHSTWAFLRGEGDFSVDEVADSITNVIYRGMAATPALAGPSLDVMVERLERVAKTLEQRTHRR